MLFHTFPLGDLATNCYILADGKGNAVVVDPADHGKGIADFLEENHLRLGAICLTHFHFDHTGGVADLAERTKAPVYVSSADLNVVQGMPFSTLSMDFQDYPETLSVGDMTLSVYRTPGHTPGSICLQDGKVLLTGDTLFAGSCGRTDFPGGSWSEMEKSLGFLGNLEGNPSVYPGHGEPSTLDAERKYNPYLREAMK